MTMEVWRPIHGFPDYEISNQKRVRNIKTDKILHITTNGRGLEVVILKTTWTAPLGRGLNKLYREAFPELVG
jgi:hypothetical protein